MDAHVRVDVDEDGPVVEKSAGGPAGDRLRHEHERLTRAVHPGVVALARRGPDLGDTRPPPHELLPGDDIAGAADRGGNDPYILRTRYAGEPVARWTGTVTGIAGLGAAVAGTLADLHGLGIVHGRVDGSHILIGDDSRPRLCGFSHPGDAAPTDDVAALAHVLGDLLTRAPSARWHRLRASAAEARALRQVLDRATDPVPTRRPSAGALADAILDAVPRAELPAPIGSAGVAGSRLPVAAADGARLPRRARPGDGEAGDVAPAARTAAGRPDTLDRIWSFAGEQSEDERWAAAFGSGPRDLPVGGVPSSAPTGASACREPADLDRPPDGGVPPLPMAPVDTPGWWAASGDGHDRAAAAELRHEKAGWHDDPGSILPDDDADRARVARSDRRRGVDDTVDPDPGDARSDRARRIVGGGDEDDEVLVTRDHRVPPARVGRARPDGDEAPSTGRARWIAVAAALVAATSLAVAGAGTVAGRSGGDGDRDAPAVAAAPARADCPPAAAPVADVDDDGCAERLVVDGSTVDAGVARWTLGEPGDVVTVGDWDCDGDASAALLRPTTGDVFVFDAWAPSDEPVTVGVSQRVDGGVGIRAEASDGACDRLLVDRADGTATTVEVPR